MTSTDNTPTIDQFRPVVLRILNDGQELAVREIWDLVADHMKLSDEVRAEVIPSGQPRYVNRINWACSGLTKAGLLERPRRGRYLITDNGRSVDKKNLSEYTEKDMLEWPEWKDYQAEVSARKNQPVTPEATASDDNADPVEVMKTTQQLFNAQTETDLRKRLQASSPEFFEKAVIDLLWAMGYGGTHGEKQRVGRSGDGGIDGVIRQDALGLTNIYIQAKRYSDANKVGEPEVRNFMGALATKNASFGVFITTSSFQPGAERTAERYPHGTIVLIDGIKLTSLMLAYGVGVQKTDEFPIYEIDDDFFDEEFI